MVTNNAPLPEFFRAFFPYPSSELLPLPLAFNRYFPQPLPKTAILRNSKGNFWRVSLTRRQGYMFFESGWPRFAEDNDLKVGEFVVFAFEAPHTFLVSIYGLSKCREKRAEVVVHEISEDEDDEVVDVGDSSDSYLLESEDEICVEEVLLETPGQTKFQASDKKGQGFCSGGCKIPRVENPKRYLDDPVSPFFVTTLKNRKSDLLVPSRVLKDYGLKFHKTVDFIDQWPHGRPKGKAVMWKDGRVCIKKWSKVCRRNKLKAEDKVICELVVTQHTVGSIKVHIIRG